MLVLDDTEQRWAEDLPGQKDLLLTNPSIKSPEALVDHADTLDAMLVRLRHIRARLVSTFR